MIDFCQILYTHWYWLDLDWDMKVDQFYKILTDLWPLIDVNSYFCLVSSEWIGEFCFSKLKSLDWVTFYVCSPQLSLSHFWGHLPGQYLKSLKYLETWIIECLWCLYFLFQLKKNVLNVDFHIAKYGQIVEELRKEVGVNIRTL